MACVFLAQRLIDPFGSDRPALQRARYGVIEVCRSRLTAIHTRRWPKLASALEVEWWGRRHHQRSRGDRCWIYYNQPRSAPNFLALKYIVSDRDCRLETFHRAVDVLDLVAEVKRSDALVCDAWNLRISDRLFARWGWEPHCPARWHRHFIKRFYGVYPEPSGEVLAAIGRDSTRAPAMV